MAAGKKSGVEILKPARQTAPVVFASPHSGRDYPPAFVESANLTAHKLRRSEDAFVDEVFLSATEFGAPLIRAHFPRAYVDANRNAFELDPEMFSDPLPSYVTTKSPRISAGLGTIPRVVANGEEIYGSRLTFAEARKRIEAHHLPYHRSLEGLVAETVADFGACLVVDCHSMPSVGSSPLFKKQTRVPDIVVGDCHGTSCGPVVSKIAERSLRKLGYSVSRNKPYSGGFTTRHYGRPVEGVHAIQIEINRSLYMDEKRITRNAGLNRLAATMHGFVKVLTSIDPALLIDSVPEIKAAE